MARSAYIYLVMQSYLDDEGEWQDKPVAPFTVKHELVTWLRRRTAAYYEDLHVLRGRDNPGPDDEFVPVSMEDLLG
jgi:hypothetical protein